MYRMGILVFIALSTLSWSAKIAVNPERMINVNAAGNVATLFDEQVLAGDPKAGLGGAPVTQYTNGWVGAALFYPMESVVDLGAVHQITDVYYYDINGSDSLYAWCGDGKNWTTLFAKSTTAYNSWVANPVTCTGRYLRFKVKSPSTAVTEMVLYGVAQGTIEALPNPTAHTKPTLGDLMGVNGFIDDDRSLLEAVGNIREYHSWMWDDGNDNVSSPAYPNNRFAWNPSAVRWTGGGWNFDDYYENLKNRNLVVAPVFQGTPAWMFGKVTGDSLKPKALLADSLNPESYRAHADYLYQFAARYGSTSVPTANLRVDAQNTARTGHGWIRYMEPWNEPDKDWKGVTGYFSPAVLATVLSADYDGHQGAMGNKVGVRNADANMKLVMPGLISINKEYVKGMKFWADQNRAGSFPADVLNFHHYCTDGGGQGSGVATTGISPEADSLRKRLEVMSGYRDRYLSGKELWLSEFGWDTHPNSVFGAQSIGGADEYEIQGRWLVRAFLEIAASGFDRAQQFMLRDTWDNSPGTFATSGLVHDKFDTLMPSYQKKVSWFYVNTLHKRMKSYRYQSESRLGSGVRIYRFVHATVPDSIALAVWNPDDAAASVSVEVDWNASSAKVVRLVNGMNLGQESTVQSVASKLQIPQVNGSPALVFGVNPNPTGILQASPQSRTKQGNTYTLKGQLLSP